MKMFGVMLLLLGLTTTADSADRAWFELTPIAGWQMGGQFDDAAVDSDQSLDEAATFGMIFNLRQSPMSQWEAYLSRQSTRIRTGPDVAGPNEFAVDADYYHVGGNLAFDGPVGQPYVAATLGATRLQPGDTAFDSSTRFSMGLGGGLKLPFNQRLAARIEVRAMATLMDGDSTVFCRSDEEGGICAITSGMFWQVAAFAGLTLRFN